MVVICYIMGVAMISIHHTDYFVVRMAMFLDLSMLICNNQRKVGYVVRNHARVERRDHAHRQSDGQYNSKIAFYLPSHLLVSEGLGPLASSPLGD